MTDLMIKRAVNNRYQRRWRQGTSPSATKAKLAAIARGRALEQLAKRYPEDFALLKLEERARLDEVEA